MSWYTLYTHHFHTTCECSPAASSSCWSFLQLQMYSIIIGSSRCICLSCGCDSFDWFGESWSIGCFFSCGFISQMRSCGLYLFIRRVESSQGFSLLAPNNPFWHNPVWMKQEIQTCSKEFGISPFSKVVWTAKPFLFVCVCVCLCVCGDGSQLVGTWGTFEIYTIFQVPQAVKGNSSHPKHG